MMQLVVDAIVGVIAAAPNAVVAETRAGARMPAGASDLPAIAVSVAVEKTTGTGFGRFVRTIAATPPDAETADVFGDRYSGTLSLQVCAASAAATADLSRRLQERLRPGPMLKQAGFARLVPASLECISGTSVQPATGSPFGFWVQRLTYGFTFEHEERSEPTSGGRIARIDVDTGPAFAERMTIQAESHHG